MRWDTSDHYRDKLKEAEKYRSAATKPTEIEMWDLVVEHWLNMIALRENEETRDRPA